MVREWSVCLGGEPLSVARTYDVHIQLLLTPQRLFARRLALLRNRVVLWSSADKSRSSHTQKDMRQ